MSDVGGMELKNEINKIVGYEKFDTVPNIIKIIKKKLKNIT
jgi:hypothetical protein